MNKACLVNWSTITKMEVWLLEAGSCFKCPYGLCQVALDLAQVVHDFTYCLTIPLTHVPGPLMDLLCHPCNLRMEATEVLLQTQGLQ